MTSRRRPDPLAGILSPKQVDFLRHSTAKVNLSTGSVRSGKTFSSILRWFLFVRSASPLGELVVIARTRDAAWRNLIAPMQNPALFGPLASQVKGNQGAPTCTILGRRCHVLGASDAKAESTIRGMTVAGALVDEATVLPEPFFMQLLARMSVPGAKAFVTTNPDSPSHWLKKLIDKGLSDWRVWPFTFEDNPSLSEDYKASLRASFNGLWFRRFVLGEWVAGEGAVFPMWDPDRFVVPAAEVPDPEVLVSLGVDHGMTNASAGVLLGVADGSLWALDEWRLDSADSVRDRLSVSQQADSLTDWLGRRSPAWTCVDPAAEAFRIELMRAGIPGLITADNDVSYGLSLISTLLGVDQLHISDRCASLIGEFPGYSWDSTAAAKGTDKPIKAADHSLDALRYSIVTTERDWRPLLERAQ